MPKVTVKLNLRGINQLMKSAEVQAALHEAGQAVARAAGDGYESETHTASFTAIENVYADTQEAYWRNVRANTLLKAAGEVGLFLRKPRL